jgi:dihydroxyacetone kinase-like predicted kinase
MEILIELIRQAVPQAQQITNIQVQEKSNGISFTWNNTNFFLNQALCAFEVKGNTVYVTTASILLQTLVRRANRDRLKALKEKEEAEQAS